MLAARREFSCLCLFLASCRGTGVSVRDKCAKPIASTNDFGRPNEGGGGGVRQVGRKEDKQEGRPAIKPVRCNRCRSVALYVAFQSRWGCANDRFVSQFTVQGTGLDGFAGPRIVRVSYRPAIDSVYSRRWGWVCSWCFGILGRQVGRTGQPGGDTDEGSRHTVLGVSFGI